MVYRDSDDNRAERTVDPAGLVAKAGVWYLVTAEPALLRVARIESCAMLDEPAPRPPGFELEAAWSALRKGVESRPRDLRVAAEARPEAAAMCRRLLARHLRNPAAAGTRLELSFNGVEHAVGRLLGLGNRLEVVEPPAVRAALRAAALDVAAMYPM
jgi:predicted DNA-binding transcriptional regulator YafY